jgi:hypothetical protein
MFDYLQQFNKLPEDLRNKISQKEVMSKVSELEKKYKVDLAALVMKVMVKQVPYHNIALYLVGEKDLNENKAEELSKELKETVFKTVNDYLETDKNKGEDSNKGIEVNKLQTEDKDNNPQELINQITKKEEYNLKIDTATQEIIDKADVSLSSAYLYDRLHLVLRTYIKGVRDKIATRSVLSRSAQEGGINLDDAIIDKLLKLADEYKKSQEPEIEKPKTKVSEEAEKIDKLEVLNENYSLKESLKAKVEEKEENKKTVKEEEDKDKKKEDLYKKLNIQKEITSPSPVVKKSEKKLEDKIKKETKEETFTSKDKNIATPAQTEKKQEFEHKNKSDNTIKREGIKSAESKSELLAEENKEPSHSDLSQAPISSGKKAMQDIKVNQRIMGPVDELRYFNLKNFRRLSSDPEEAFVKVRDKIEVLAKESYEKRIEGIKAWKENPLNKLYHQISRESLDKARPISEVIQARQENNIDTLSNEELKALIAFNRSYMF